MLTYSPEQALAETKREFGEHGGVTPSIAKSSTFTVMDPAIIPEIFGGMMTIDCGTQIKADALLSCLQNQEDFGYIAVSLGYFDTLMSCSSSTTSSEIDPKDQHRMGLSPGLVRLSIGLTGSLHTRIQQIDRAVKAVGLASA